MIPISGKPESFLGNEDETNLDAFIRIVSGVSTSGNQIFNSGETYHEAIQEGKDSLETLIAANMGNSDAISHDQFKRAKDFMEPLHEARQQLFKEILEAEERARDD